MLLDAHLQPIKEHGDKLLNVLLHHDVDRFSKRFVSDAEGRRRKVQTSCSFKISEDALDLVENIIIDRPLLGVGGPHRRFLILDSQYQVPEITVHV